MKKNVLILLSVISLIMIATTNMVAQGTTVNKSSYKMTLNEFQEYFSKVKLDGYTFQSAEDNGRGGYGAIFGNNNISGATVTFDLVPHEVFLTYKDLPGNKKTWERVMYSRKGYKSYFLDTKNNTCVVVEAQNLGGTFAVYSFRNLLSKKELEKLLDKSGFYSIKK